MKVVSDDAIYRDAQGTERVVEWVTQLGVDIARRITEIAADQEVAADPASVSHIELGQSHRTRRRHGALCDDRPREGARDQRATMGGKNRRPVRKTFDTVVFLRREAVDSWTRWPRRLAEIRCLMSDNPQARIWNETVGDAWASNARHYDAMLEPFGAAVIAALDIRADERVVDVGCGTGATTVELARRSAMVLGVDLSVPMLATARERAVAAKADNVAFTAVDVQAAPFATNEFDVAFSRFGVMFFTDPVLAFTHVRGALVDGGRLGFVCFQAPVANPFILVPVMAAASHLAMPPPPQPTDPGPFSLADVERTTSILVAAGFVDVTVEAGPTSVELGAADDLAAVARRVLEQNPGTAPALLVASDADRRAAIDATVAALTDHVTDGIVVLAAGSWIVSAHAG